MILELISWLVYKMGARYSLIDYKGAVHMTRLYLLFAPRNDSWFRLPNLYLHRFPPVAPPEYAHDHGRWCVSFVLCGSYTEIRNGKEIERKRFSFSVLSPNDQHKIVRVDECTWTLFAVGRQLRRPKFYDDNGSAANRVDHLTEGFDGKNLKGWQKDTAELAARLARRRQAFARHSGRNA